MPRVDYGHAGCLEITYLPGDNRHAMHERSCCDEGIPIGAGIWHNPSPKNRAELSVTALDEKGSYF